MWCWVFGVCALWCVTAATLDRRANTEREREKYPEMKKGSNVEWSEMQRLCLTEDEGDSEQRKME